MMIIATIYKTGCNDEALYQDPVNSGRGRTDPLKYKNNTFIYNFLVDVHHNTSYIKLDY